MNEVPDKLTVMYGDGFHTFTIFPYTVLPTMIEYVDGYTDQSIL